MSIRLETTIEGNYIRYWIKKKKVVHKCDMAVNLIHFTFFAGRSHEIKYTRQEREVERATKGLNMKSLSFACS